MANPYVNKVVINGETKLDLSGDTITADKLAEGYTAHDASGAPITGTMTGGGSGGIPDTITAGDTPVILCQTVMYKPTNSSSLAATGLTITIPLAGTYRIKWGMEVDQDSGTIRTRLYRNGTAIGTEQTQSSGAKTCSLDVDCSAGDTIELYARAGSYWGYACGACGGLCACIDWDNGFTGG